MSRHDLAAMRSRNQSLNRFARGGVTTKDDKYTAAAIKMLASFMPNPEVIAQGTMDPKGTAQGLLELASIGSPAANIYRGYKAATGGGLGITGADESDINQAIEIAGIIPYAKGAKAGQFAAKYGPDLVELTGRGIREGAERLGGAGYDATTVGLRRGATPQRVGRRGRPTKAEALVKAMQARNIIAEASGIPSYAGKFKSNPRINRVEAARERAGYESSPPTPEVQGKPMYGGAETHKLTEAQIEDAIRDAAEYEPPEVYDYQTGILKEFGYSIAEEDYMPAKGGATFARDLSLGELRELTKRRLAGIRNREKKVNADREARGQQPFDYTPHFDPSQLNKKELVTLWGNNPLYVRNASGEVIPGLGADLGHGPGRPLIYGGKAELGILRGQRAASNRRWGAEN